jgi:hypothetical protein
VQSLVPDSTVALPGALNALAAAHGLSFPSPLEGIVGQDYLGELAMIRDSFDDPSDRSRDKLRLFLQVVSLKFSDAA